MQVQRVPLYKSLVSAVVCCVATLLIAGCGDSSTLSPTDPNAPVTAVTVAGTANPLVASFTVALPKAGNVSVEFSPDTSYTFSTSQQHTPATGSNQVTLLVAGMKANSTYHMRAKVEYDDGGTTTGTDQTFTTGSLPAGLIPSFTVATTSGLTPQPGVELVNTLVESGPSTAFATDIQGNVIWAYPNPDFTKVASLLPVKLLPNGHFMGLMAPPVYNGPPAPGTLNEIREFDLVGNTIRSLTMSDLNAKLATGNFNLTLVLFSHDFAYLPNGHILVLADVIKQFTDLPGYPGVTNVLGDAVVDLDTNLNPVWVWNEFDHFDVNRHPMMFPDWTHSNSIAYSPDDGNFIVSIRHQHWVVKVDYRDGSGTGNVVWRLGAEGDFKLEGATDPTDWFYAQHDANFVSTNTTGSFKLAVLDNGDFRQFPPNVTCNGTGAPPCLYTTVPVMQVDENAKTASYLFHQILPVPFYNGFAGSNRVLANNNIEYNLAAVGGTDAYTFEVTPTATPQTVWQMRIPKNYTYRSIRMPSLYPGVQW